MARLIVGTARYTLPPETDVDRLIAAIIAAMNERTGLAVTVEGDGGRPLQLIVNCAFAETIAVDPAGADGADGDDGAVPKGGRISG
jgi:hypothetical protein